MHKGKGAYNIGGGNRISIYNLAKEIIKITNSKSSIKYTNSEKGDAEHTLANIDRAKRELGWAPRIILGEGLRRYSEWILNCQS